MKPQETQLQNTVVTKQAEYTTQMDAARKGIVTPQMKVVSEKSR